MARVPAIDRLNKIRLKDKAMPVRADTHTDSGTTASPIILNTEGQAPKAIMIDSPGASDVEVLGSIDNVKFKILGRIQIADPDFFDAMERNPQIPWGKYQFLKFDKKAGVNVTITAYSAGLA